MLSVYITDAIGRGAVPRDTSRVEGGRVRCLAALRAQDGSDSFTLGWFWGRSDNHSQRESDCRRVHQHQERRFCRCTGLDDDDLP